MQWLIQYQFYTKDTNSADYLIQSHEQYVRLKVYVFSSSSIIEILQKCQVKESPIPGAGSGNFAAQVTHLAT